VFRSHQAPLKVEIVAVRLLAGFAIDGEIGPSVPTIDLIGRDVAEYKVSIFTAYPGGALREAEVRAQRPDLGIRWKEFSEGFLVNGFEFLGLGRER